MFMGSLLSEVILVAREILRDDKLVLESDTRFDAIPGWDPTDLVSVIVELECRFDVQFELPEIDRIATVDDLMRMIVAKRALAAA
jgi:acyl carrier protein